MIMIITIITNTIMDHYHRCLTLSCCVFSLSYTLLLCALVSLHSRLLCSRLIIHDGVSWTQKLSSFLQKTPSRSQRFSPSSLEWVEIYYCCHQELLIPDIPTRSTSFSPQSFLKYEVTCIITVNRAFTFYCN